MLTFPLALGRLTYARRQRHPLRELGLGVLVGGVMCIGLAASTRWTLVVLAGYFALAQIVSGVENRVFLQASDLRAFGMRGLDRRFISAYVAHQLGADLTVGIAAAQATVWGWALSTGRGSAALLLTLLWVASVAAMPIHAFYGFRSGNGRRAVYLALLLVPALLVFWLLRPGSSVLTGPHPSALLIGAVAVGLVVQHGLMRGLASGVESVRRVREPRHLTAWLRPISMSWFRDVTLLRGSIVMHLVQSLALMALLLVGTPASYRPAVVFFALAHENLMLTRGGGRYRIVADDNLFSELALPADALGIRRSKLRSIALDAPLKLAAFALALALLGQWSLHAWVLAAAALLTIAVVEYPSPYLLVPRTRWLRMAAKYVVLLGFSVAWLGGAEAAGLLLTSYGVIAATYIGPFLRTFAFPVTSLIAPYHPPPEVQYVTPEEDAALMAHFLMIEARDEAARDDQSEFHDVSPAHLSARLSSEPV